MMRMIDKDSKTQLSTFSDLRRAAFVCIFQACLISFHFVIAFYTSFYVAYIYYWINDNTSQFYYDLYTVLDVLKYTIYQAFVIIDTTVVT
uniref:Uncharacterized protein n=1 Tax=Acrobeloides nanus TaxID=290746 RepID=A0A914CUF1_9BILA